MEPFMFLILALVLAGLLFWIDRKRPKRTDLGRAADASLDFETSIRIRRKNEFPRLNE